MKRCFLVSCVVVAYFSLLMSTSAQNAASIATPEAPVAPRFAMTAVGDYPNGFFEDVEVVPGHSVDLAVEIRNTGEIPVDLRTFKVNALAGLNGGYVPGVETDAPFPHTEWLNYDPQTLFLEPGEAIDIQFTVAVPPNTPPGQYITGLMVQTAEPLSIVGTDSMDQVLGYTITVGILVPGEIGRAFLIEVPQLEVSESGRTLYVPVTNTGGYLVRPVGTLEILDTAGDIVVSSPVQMGSIYAGLSAPIQLHIPQQLQPGEYRVSMELTDEQSGVTQALTGVSIEIPAPVDPTGVSVASAMVEPNADPIGFANIDVTVSNGGQQIPASNVMLKVMRDGELVEEYPLATNQVLLEGENQYTDRYIPAEMWESGTYTFTIVVSAVDPNGGQETILLDEELDATIEVP